MPLNKRILILVSLVILVINISATADWKEDAKAIDISGGENHILGLSYRFLMATLPGGHLNWFSPS